MKPAKDTALQRGDMETPEREKSTKVTQRSTNCSESTDAGLTGARTKRCVNDRLVFGCFRTTHHTDQPQVLEQAQVKLMGQLRRLGDIQSNNKDEKPKIQDRDRKTWPMET